MGDGVDRQPARDALVVNRHHDRRETCAQILVEKLALAGVTISPRHPRAVAVDGDLWRRKSGLDGHEDEIRKLVLEPLGLVFRKARHRLRAGIEPQPRVQKITLLDRFDDRWPGALEFQGGSPGFPKLQTIVGIGKFSMKGHAPVRTPLTKAFDGL